MDINSDIQAGQGQLYNLIGLCIVYRPRSLHKEPQSESTEAS